MDVLKMQQGQSDFCKCYSVKLLFYFIFLNKIVCAEHCLLSFLNYNICVKHYFLFSFFGYILVRKIPGAS